jgi:hypothetical protein
MMDIKSQRKVDRIFGTVICRILSLLPSGKQKLPRGARPNRILIILLSEMGSLALSRPMFSHIKEKYPDSSMHVLLFEQNKEFLDILGVIPSENVITISNASFIKMMLTSIRAVFKIRRKKN